MGLLPDMLNCGLCMHRECRERFPHHRGLTIPTCIPCVTHVPWCMPRSLTRGFLWNRWRGKRSRRMRNPQFYVYGKRPLVELCLIIQEVWSVIPQAIIARLGPFMSRRCRVVHEANGLSQPLLTLLHLMVCCAEQNATINFCSAWYSAWFMASCFFNPYHILFYVQCRIIFDRDISRAYRSLYIYIYMKTYSEHSFRKCVKVQ